MSEPLKAGDLAEVINALGRGKSPNIGLRVKVLSLQGEHSQYGRVWRCENPDLVQYDDMGGYVKKGWADIPGVWLKKINPDVPPPESINTTEDREITA
jgi:hypothetical protein